MTKKSDTLSGLTEPELIALKNINDSLSLKRLNLCNLFNIPSLFSYFIKRNLKILKAK